MQQTEAKYLDPVTQQLLPVFFAELFGTPRGRAWHYRLMAQLEQADEGAVFAELLSRIEDRELHAMVRIHRDDEQRHALLMLACAERTGIPAEAVPPSVNSVFHLERELHFAEAFCSKRFGVMEAYVLLLVLEERAVRQFPIHASALDPFDAEGARVVRSILRDEQRHVRYARAISRRYARDAHSLAATTQRFREAEVNAFVAGNLAYLRCALERGLLPSGPIH